MPSPLPPTLNGNRCVGIRFSVPWRGVWVAEVEIDSSLPETVILAGPAILIVGGITMRGTIDPRGSGAFAGRVTARVVGGANGWDKEVTAQHFTIPGGSIPSTLVTSATALEVGEIAADSIPVPLGENYVRSKGPASRVLGDRDWHVEPITGITIVGVPWVPIPLDPIANIVDFNASEGRATVVSESLILPGTILVDPRFGTATYTVRDVQQVFISGALSAECWISKNAVSPLQASLSNMIREFGRTAYLKIYRYRYALPVGTTKVALQAISPSAPDLNPIDQWTGLSGALDGLQPGTEVMVGFADGDPSYPFLVSFSPDAVPLTQSFTASASISMLAPTVNVGAIPLPVATAAYAAGLNAALMTLAGSLGSATTVVNVAAAGTALGLALAALPPLGTTVLKAQ